MFERCFLTYVKEILKKLDLGNSVAEHDLALEKYFVETETFRALVTNRVDIVAGDKGTGKTAIYSILQKRYTELPELANVQIVPGFNVSGSSVFQRLTQTEVLHESQYITVWKAYILSLIGNWVLGATEGAQSKEEKELDNLLTKMGLRTVDSSPKTVFSKLLNTLNRIMFPSAAQVAIEVTQYGFPIVTPRVEFGDAKSDEQTVEIIRHEEALDLLNIILDNAGLSVWLVLDRLDEAFQGFPNTEIPALRALLRTYLDLQNEFPRISLKLFLRKDLFRRIIQGGFVNLTHVNAKK